MKTIHLIETTPQQLADLINVRVKIQLQEFKKELSNQTADEELMTRDETCKFLSVDSSTLWSWTKKGKIKAYGIGNRRYYKRSELLEALIAQI